MKDAENVDLYSKKGIDVKDIIINDHRRLQQTDQSKLQNHVPYKESGQVIHISRQGNRDKEGGHAIHVLQGKEVHRDNRLRAEEIRRENRERLKMKMQEKRKLDDKQFLAAYSKACNDLGFQKNLCTLQGVPTIKTTEYKKVWKLYWDSWKEDTCNQLGTKESQKMTRENQEKERILKSNRQRRNKSHFGNIRKKMEVFGMWAKN